MAEDDLQDMLLTLEDLARLCAVERDWVLAHVEEGLLPCRVEGETRQLFSSAALVRARRMRRIERDFDAAPELAALFADMMEELDAMRALVRRSSLG
jgi:chaperone modulatory protein CbpM